MPIREVFLPALPPALAAGLASVRATLEVPDAFPPEVVVAAEQAARSPRLPALDRTDLEFLTIDPEGSRDLDQAVHIARARSGFRVEYAIADVAAFVRAGDPVDEEAHRRGMTLYAPDRRTPLHPPELSEGAASLLPDQVRPALLWTITLDERGRMTDADVARALVRSRAQLTYAEAQAEIDGGSPRETLELLSLVGRRRERREVERGGASLPTPEQEVVTDEGGWRLTFRAPLPVEGWNAQISLLTGMAAAHLMLYGQIGVLRTMPPADPGAIRRLRRTARALDVPWPDEVDYPDFVRSLDPAQPRQAAVLNACTSLFRGAGYKAFSGGVPEDVEHAALAIDYAHVTAPLRRLVDRYAGEICVALCADQPVPEWVRQRLDGLPEEMAGAERRAKRYERAVVDLVEAFLLSERVGETFTGTVVEVDRERDKGTVVIADPAVSAKVVGARLPLGERVSVRLTSAEVTAGKVSFELV